MVEHLIATVFFWSPLQCEKELEQIIARTHSVLLPQDSIICMFNILYERVDYGLVLVCWCINKIILTDQFGWMENGRTRQSMTMLQIIE